METARVDSCVHDRVRTTYTHVYTGRIHTRSCTLVHGPYTATDTACVQSHVHDRVHGCVHVYVYETYRFLPRDAAMLARSWESYFSPSVRRLSVRRLYV